MFQFKPLCPNHSSREIIFVYCCDDGGLDAREENAPNFWEIWWIKWPGRAPTSFVSTMAFYSSSDPMWCRAFSLSAKGEALTWFNSLPPNIVDCFSTICTLFDMRYASNRAQSLTYLRWSELSRGRMSYWKNLWIVIKRPLDKWNMWARSSYSTTYRRRHWRLTHLRITCVLDRQKPWASYRKGQLNLCL